MLRNRIQKENDEIRVHENKPSQVKLYSFDMIPEYLQSNPYILTGYRYGLTFKQCLFR